MLGMSYRASILLEPIKRPSICEALSIQAALMLTGGGGAKVVILLGGGKVLLVWARLRVRRREMVKI